MSNQILHCRNGDHQWEREKRPGRAPVNCPEHPLAPNSRQKRAQDSIEAAAAKLAAHRERMASAEEREEQAFIAMGSIRTCSNKAFAEWLRSNDVLLGECIALRRLEA